MILIVLKVIIMNRKNLLVLLSYIYFLPLYASDNAKPKKQRENEKRAEQTQAVKFEPKSLLKTTMLAFFKQEQENLSEQLTQYPLPEELNNPLFISALESYQPKNTLITLIKNLNLSPENCEEVAADIVYSPKNIHLLSEDKVEVISAMQSNLEHDNNHNKKTIIILDVFKKAFQQSFKKNLELCEYTTIDSQSLIFQYCLNETQAPSEAIALLLKHGLPHDTNQLVGNFVKTFEDIHDQKLRADALRKLSLLVDAQAPLYNEVCESSGKVLYHNTALIHTPSGKVFNRRTSCFPTPYDYLQHKVTSIFKQESNNISLGKAIDVDANNKKKEFYMQAYSLLKPEYTLESTNL